MTEHEIAFVKKCIRENIHRFYTWGKWKALREQVLKLDKYECQLCKKRGKYTGNDGSSCELCKEASR